MIDEMLIAKIRSYFSANDDTYAVYLFGSQAKAPPAPQVTSTSLCYSKRGSNLTGAFR